MHLHVCINVFATDAEVILTFDDNVSLNCFAVDKYDRILIGGSIADNPSPYYYDAFLMRLHPDGSIDESFGTSGIVQFESEFTDFIDDITLQLIKLYVLHPHITH
jgi:hypothetical protein